MTRKAFNNIAEGLNEALLVARGEARPPKLPVRAELDAGVIRKGPGMSQEEFGLEFGFTLDQTRNWEQGHARPIHGGRAYLFLIAHKEREIIGPRDQVRSKARAA